MNPSSCKMAHKWLQCHNLNCKRVTGNALKNLFLVFIFIVGVYYCLNNETISGSYHWIDVTEYNNILCSAEIYLSNIRK